MKNDLYIEKIQSTLESENKINHIQLSKKLFINDYDNINSNQNMNDNANVTLSTHKSSIDSLSSFQEKEIPSTYRTNLSNAQKNALNIIVEEPKKRKDNFGREIKKGGKHKIAFADDLQIIKSLMPDNNENNSKKSSKIKKYSPSKKTESFLPPISNFKRTNTITIPKSSMKKNIYNISKIRNNRIKDSKKVIVDVINIENLKKETKLNTYSVKNRLALAEEENVSCSCYCSIW